jgi:hypothetical protein
MFQVFAFQTHRSSCLGNLTADAEYMAKRRSPRRGLSKKKPTITLELTRIKLLYGLSGVFTLAVAGLLLARPAPLPGDANMTALAAQSQDPLDSAIQPGRGLDTSAWKRITIERADSLGSASFHFAVLPQSSGDQIAISAEWSRQAVFSEAPGELRIMLISSNPDLNIQEEKTIQQLVQRLTSRLGLGREEVVWR